MHRKLFFPILLIIALLISACGGATPATTLEPTSVPEIAPTETSAPTAQATVSTEITLTDGLGREVKLAGPAQKIISLAPSNTEILFTIGAGSQVVGRDAFSDYPTEAQKAENIGGGFDKLNTELILSLAPDLVLAADITPPEQVKALEDLGMTVYVVKNPTTLDELYENLRIVASLTGHEAETETLVTSLQARVKAVDDKIATVTEKPLVYYEIDGTDANAPWTSGPGTFIDTLITQAGGVNVGGTLKDSFAQISLEELVKQNPEIIVLGSYTWGGVTPELVQQRGGWDGLSAVKSGKMFTFDDNTVSRPGPRLVDGLEALAKLLHPELFQ